MEREGKEEGEVKKKNRKRKKKERNWSPESNQAGGETILNQVTEELLEATLLVRPKRGRNTQNTSSLP